MENLYNINGLIFWSEEEIIIRRMMEDYFVNQLTNNLKSQNSGFEIIQTEAPILTPKRFINPNYTADDTLSTQENLVLRPETTMGSYEYALFLLNPHHNRKIKLPFVVWQHGKSFRNEQDQVVKNIRLKEFYQLEFQILYSPSTMNDYSISLIPAVEKMISNLIGQCKIEDSDRIPDYAEWTKDVVCINTNLEVCSISKRTDLEDINVLEVAIGTDRCIYSFSQK